MGCCQSSSSKYQGMHEQEQTAPILLPQKPLAKGIERGKNPGQQIRTQQQSSNSKFKQTKKRNNPGFDPYRSNRVSAKHENNHIVSKLLQGLDFLQQQFQQDQDKYRDDENYKRQEIDLYDISTQINPLYITNKYENMQDQMQQQGVYEFIDPEFPHNKNSISKYVEGEMPEAEDYTWVKSNICIDKPNLQEMAVFTGGVDPCDIVQGALGDCYFLCSLSALAERPGLIKRLFKTKDVEKDGLYSVWLCINGEWQEILLDDYFPCYDNKPAFSNSVGEELWVLLLEKAYAKVFGGYDKIQAGLTGEAIRDLTGAPNKWIPTSKGDEEVWEFIKSHDSRGHIMTAGSQQEAENMEIVDGRREQDMGKGIVSGHAYSILDHRVIYNPDEVRLVQLRNPWGCKEWEGDWSDKSPLWTEELREQLGVDDKDDGIFWMDVRDLCVQFSEVTTNMLEENSLEDRYVYNSMKITFPQNTRKALVKMVVPNAGTQGYIQLSQKDARFYYCEPYKNYQYAQVKLIVTQSDFSSYIGDICIEDRDMFVENTFEQTTYYAYIEVDWTEDQYDTDFVVISSYASQYIAFDGYEILENSDDSILDKMLLAKPPQNPDKVYRYQNHHIQRYINDVAGYFVFNYHNYTDNVTLQETVNMENREYLDICPPYFNSDEFTVTLKPQEVKIVKYKLDPEGYGGYGYSVSYQSEILLNDNDLVQQIKQEPKSITQREVNGELLPIWIYSYFYSQGLALYWENQSESIYQEKLTIKLQNLQLEDQQLQQYQQQGEYFENNSNAGSNFEQELEIYLHPGETRMVKFKVIDPEIGISYSTRCSYQLM